MELYRKCIVGEEEIIQCGPPVQAADTLLFGGLHVPVHVLYADSDNQVSECNGGVHEGSNRVELRIVFLGADSNIDL